MRTPSKALSALFGLSLLGVLVVGGLAASMVGGLPAVAGYAVVVVLLLVVGIAKVRRLAAAAPPPPRACTCCDGDHAEPVTVV